jgi:hypothetical protein
LPWRDRYGLQICRNQPAPPPQAPVAYMPVVAPVYNWGGIYYGINGGYGFGHSDWTNPLIASGSTGNFNI